MNANEFLVKLTGRDAVWWVAAVQRAVQESSPGPSDDPNHDLADHGDLLARVSRLVAESLPPAGESYDPNMRSMMLMGVVASLWYGRVHFAKCHDPARPSSLRRAAYAGWLDWTSALMSIPLDERMDAAHFSTQRWDFPFSFDAEDGSFI